MSKVKVTYTEHLWTVK